MIAYVGPFFWQDDRMSEKRPFCDSIRAKFIFFPKLIGQLISGIAATDCSRLMEMFFDHQIKKRKWALTNGDLATTSGAFRFFSIQVANLFSWHTWSNYFQNECLEQQAWPSLSEARQIKPQHICLLQESACWDCEWHPFVLWGKDNNNIQTELSVSFWLCRPPLALMSLKSTAIRLHAAHLICF